MIKQDPNFDKIISQPIIPIKGGWIDALPFMLMFLLLAISSFFLWRNKKSELARWIIRFISIILFVFIFFQCLCLVRLSVFGMSQIGWDDFAAFGNFYMFVLIGAFTLVFGRVFCGWICPFGCLQEISRKALYIKKRSLKITVLLFLLAAAIFFLYYFKPANDFLTENVIALWSVALLAILLLGLLIPKLEPFLLKIKYLSVALYILVTGILVFFSEAWCPLYGSEIDYSAIIAFFVIILSSTVIGMAWCRYLCPTGTALSLMSRCSLFKIKPADSNFLPTSGDDLCPTGALKKGKIDFSLCIFCGKCKSSNQANTL